MKPREKIMVGILGTVVALYLGDRLFQSALREPLQAREKKIQTLNEKIESMEARISKVRKDAKELEVWESRSLPTDTEVARSLYQSWLLELIEQVHLAQPNVDSGEPINRAGIYQSMAFSVRGQGTLEQLTQFLYSFYHSGHLHKIDSLNITPLQKGGQLDISFAIEALILPGTERKESLSATDSDLLAFDSLSAYQPIIQRNIFSAAGPSSNSIELTYLTAVTFVNGEPQAWFRLRATDKLLKLSKGDNIHVGPFHGIVHDIFSSDVVIESDNERWLITVGESLAQAEALPPEF